MDESQISAYVELFELPDSFTEAQLKQAYRDLVQVWHPDKHAHHERLRLKAEEKMKEINEAYEALNASLVNGAFRLERTPGAPRPETAQGKPAQARPGRANPDADSASPPEDSPRAATVGHEPKGLSGNAFWLLIIGLILLVIIAAPRSRKIAPADPSDAAPPPTQADLPPLFSIDGPQTGSNTPSLLLATNLDLKNGFRDLKFGMSIDQARRLLKPDRVTTNQYDQLVVFWYGPGKKNKLADFPLDEVSAYFFREKLFRVEAAFSSNAQGLIQTLTESFGAPRPDDSMSRDGAPVRAECWWGEKVFCAIVAPGNSDGRTGWDGLVMYDRTLNLEASNYARQEPVRAARALSEDGFGEFRFGMTVGEFGRKLGHVPKASDTGVGQSEVVVSNSDTLKLGRYPMTFLRASFFQSRLYKLELNFENNRQPLLEAFISRFPAATNSDAWTRNDETLRAKQFTGPSSVAVILAPRSGGPLWDSIILYDRKLDEQRREFERDAPRRAAKAL